MPENPNNLQGILKDLAPVVEDAYAIKDDLGFIKYPVWMYEKNGDSEPVWKRILPTPKIVDNSQNAKLLALGEVLQGDLFLKQIPVNSYTEDDLRTSFILDNDEEEPPVRYWIINKFAFTTQSIKRNYLHYEVHITRSDNINEGELVPPEESNGSS